MIPSKHYGWYTISIRTEATLFMPHTAPGKTECFSVKYEYWWEFADCKWALLQGNNATWYNQAEVLDDIKSRLNTPLGLPKWLIGITVTAQSWNAISTRDLIQLTHEDRVTHICVSKLTIIGSDDGLSPGRRQAIIWTNDGILLIRPLGTNFSEILIEILIFSFKKMRLKVSSAKGGHFVSASMC